ncbi:TPA: cold shock domain-containing protein [Neisseria gonorrhoeae]
MIGFVKWYSYEKDFGFIFGEDGHEYFFRKSAGSDIPGQIVNFEPFEHSRGLRARKVSNIHNPDPQQIQKLKTLCKDFQKVEKQPMSKKYNLLFGSYIIAVFDYVHNTGLFLHLSRLF